MLQNLVIPETHGGNAVGLYKPAIPSDIVATLEPVLGTINSNATFRLAPCARKSIKMNAPVR
jgi:hypothetical protein